MPAQTKKVTIEGVEYTFQRIPTREWIRLQERCQDRRGNISTERLASEILEHIVVEPKVKIDDFEIPAVMEEVVAEAYNFQHGKKVL